MPNHTYNNESNNLNNNNNSNNNNNPNNNNNSNNNNNPNNNKKPIINKQKKNNNSNNNKIQKNNNNSNNNKKPIINKQKKNNPKKNDDYNNHINNYYKKRDLQKLGQNIIQKYLEILNTIKLFHWKTYSYSIHKATDELYSDLNNLFDEFVEVMLGKSKERVNLTKVKTLVLNDFDDVEKLINKINHFQSYLIHLNKKLNKESDSDLLNIRDEILGKLDQFMYLLTLK